MQSLVSAEHGVAHTTSVLETDCSRMVYPLVFSGLHFPCRVLNVTWPQRFIKLTSALFGAGELLQTNMLISAIHES